MGKLKKSLLISLAALFVAAIAVFGILHMNFAHAAEVSVTVQSDGNGNVSAKDQSGAQITISAEQGSSVEITASPTEGYVFAYWYIEENTPLSYDEVYSYSIPAATTTLHAKFFKNEDKMTVTASEDYWDTKTEGTYQIKSGTEYNFSPQQDIPIYFEFVGEKWFNFDYNLSVKTDGYYYGYIYVFVDGLQYISQSFSTGAVTSTSNCLKTIESKYHRVEIRYQTPNDERAGHTSSQVPTALEFTLSNISLKEESAFETTQATVTWDKRLGDAYILPGVVKATGDTNDEFIIAHGKQLQNEDGSATVSVPVGVPIAFAIKPFEQVDSTIVPEQKTGVYYGGVNYGTITYSKAISLKFDEEGKVAASESTNYSETNISFNLKEIAFAPKVSITKVIDSVYQREETISDNGRVELPYGKTNNLLVTIQHYETVTNTFSVTSQGQEVSCENLMGKTGFSLNDITENKTVVITYKYEDKYYVEGPFTFNVYIKLGGGNDGLDSIISPVSSEITVTNDEQFPWYFDPAGNGEGSFAFSSGISYQPNSTLTVPAFSQLGFTVKGNGSFTFEFHIDGYGGKGADTDDTKAKYSYAAYRIGSPIPTSTAYTSGWLANNEKWTNADWGVKGFKASIATNLGWGLSTAADEPIAPKTFNAETVDAKNYWYKVTIQVQNKRDDEETVFYIAHAIGNKSNSSFACMSVRNVAFFSGNAYVDWDVQNSGGASGEKSDITVKKGAGAAASGIIAAGTAVTFEANPQGGRTFYGWKAVTGTLKPESMGKAETPEQIEDSDIQWDVENARFISYDLKYNYIVGVGYVKIVAVVDAAGTYAVRHENKFYSGDEIETALAAAKNAKDKNVYVVDNVTLDSIEVPADVNLVIPYDRAGSYYATGTAATAQNRVSWATSGIYKDPVYTITLNGENTLYGNLYVGGVLHYPDQSAQGHTSGAYSQLILNGNLSVESGGHFDVYGRVTGDGAIDVKSGGKLSQPFMITDYNGGTNTEASFNAGVTPFKMYAMVNVQNKGGFTINHGAELWGHASLYFWESITTIDTPFISYVERHEGGKDYFKNAALIILNDGAQAHIVYDDTAYASTENGQHKRVEMKAGDNTQDVGFTKIEITGNAYAGYMQFPLGINTTKVYFSVPYNYDITLKSGQFDILYPYKLMPGASFTVEQQATLVVRSEAGLQVYDSFYGPEVEKRAYPTGAQLIAAGYKPYANFVVNGTLDIKDNAHFVGTVQNNGTGTIKIGKGATLKEDDLFDGVATEYSCNYTKYSLVAHVWDSAHGDGEMRMLEAGKTYTAVAGDITFTLPGILFKYDANTAASGDHSHRNGLAETTTAEAQGLKGSWKVTHTGHTFNWDSPTAEDKQFGDENFKELTRQCTELGCNEEEHKCLLKPVEIPAKDYRGNAYTAEELFKEIYKNLPEYVQFEFPQSPVMLNASELAYSFTVTITSGGYFLEGESFETSHTFEFKINKLNISQAEVSGLEDLTYNGNAQTPSLTVTVNGVSAGNNVDFSVEFENNVNAGDSAQVTLTGIGENFTGELVKTFTIGKKSIQVNIVKPAAHTYDGKIPQISSERGANWTVDAGAIASQGGKEDDLKIVLSIENASKNVGKYTINGAYTNQNYDVEFIGGESAFEITPKAITVTAENKVINYGDEEEALTWTIAEGQLATGDERSVLDSLKLTRQPGNVVNSYTISGEPETQTIGNYTVTVTPGVYTINKKDITVTADNKTITYGDTDEKLTWSIADGELVNGDGKEVLDITLTRAEGKAANDYTISGTGTADNYKITVTPGTYTINKKDIAVTVNKQECVYNGQKQTVKSGTSFWKLKNDGSLVSGDSCDDLKITLSGEGKEVGKYAIICKSEAANYSVTFEGDTEGFEITKATITVKADDKNSHEGETLAELTVTVTGAYEHEIEEYVRSMVEITLADGAAEGHAGDNFEISISLKSEYHEPDNYTVKLSEVKGTYSITDAVFKDVKFSGGEPVTYDGESHKLTATDIPDGAEAKYLYQNEEFTGATDVGEYEITLKVTMGEFKPLELKATLKITPKTITVTAENKTIKYGDKEEALTWTIAEGQLAARDDRSVLNSLKLTRQPGNGVNSYTISGEPETQTIGNYTVTVTSGVYTINKKDITVTADNITVTYGDEEKPLTFTVPEGALVEGDHDSDLAVVLVREQGEDVRDYRITGTSTSKNYNVTVTPAIYKIEKFDISGKELTVTGLKGLVYNGSAQTPELTVKAGKLTVTFDNPEFSNNVNATENAKVTIKGNNNFTGEKEITFKISPREIKVALRAQTVVYNGEIPNPKQDEWDVKEGEICTVGDIQDNLQIVVTITSPNRNANTYGLTGESHNANYKVEVTGSTITITPKPITVTADNITVTYGDTDEKLTWSIADGELVGGDDKSILNITLTREPGADAGEYGITGPQNNTQDNYTVTVTAGLYKIERRKLTVDITAESVTYNGGEQSHSGAYKVSSGEIKEGDEVSLAIKVNAKGTNVNKYSATTSYNGKNYEIEFNGKENAFTITAKPITVTIEDQTSEYSGKEPAIDETKWTEDGKIGEDDLNIILTKEEGGNAGEYDITGTCGNANYDVTWKNGTFTITQKPVTGIMVIVSDGTNDYSDSGDGVIHAKFGGQPLTISAGAPNPYQDLHVETSVTEITETGSYTVTARIVETNYSGEITVKIEVAPDLSIALERLAALKAQLSGEELTAEDFGIMKQINDLINGLAEEDRESDELNEYKELIESWNAAAGIDEEIITQANSLADEIISGIIAAISAAAAIAYVAIFGGKAI